MQLAACIKLSATADHISCSRQYVSICYPVLDTQFSVTASPVGESLS